MSPWNTVTKAQGCFTLKSWIQMHIILRRWFLKYSPNYVSVPFHSTWPCVDNIKSQEDFVDTCCRTVTKLEKVLRVWTFCKTLRMCKTSSPDRSAVAKILYLSRNRFPTLTEWTCKNRTDMEEHTQSAALPQNKHKRRPTSQTGSSVFWYPHQYWTQGLGSCFRSNKPNVKNRSAKEELYTLQI